MSFNWGENIFIKIYPLISDLYSESLVLDKPKANVILLQKSVGYEVEKRLKQLFVPSFFTQDLCEKNSLIGRVSSTLFFICEKLRLHKNYQCLNQDSKLFNIVLKAERAWLSTLLDAYEHIPTRGRIQPRENQKKVQFIAEHLTSVVKKSNEEISNEEVQDRLNKSVALTNIYYEIHKKGHEYVTGRVPHAYFKSIFDDLNKYNTMLA